MLKLINTKILLAILAALTVIGGAVIYQRRRGGEGRRSRRQSSGHPSATAEGRQRVPEAGKRGASGKQVEADKKRHNSAAAHEGKTWKKYIP